MQRFTVGFLSDALFFILFIFIKWNNNLSGEFATSSVSATNIRNVFLFSVQTQIRARIWEPVYWIDLLSFKVKFHRSNLSGQFWHNLFNQPISNPIYRWSLLIMQDLQKDYLFSRNMKKTVKIWTSTSLWLFFRVPYLNRKKRNPYTSLYCPIVYQDHFSHSRVAAASWNSYHILRSTVPWSLKKSNF